jgi:hypothetical protein
MAPSWWQSLVHKHWRRAGATGRRSGPARQFRPAVTSLEDRVVPAGRVWHGPIAFPVNPPPAQGPGLPGLPTGGSGSHPTGNNPPSALPPGVAVPW